MVHVPAPADQVVVVAGGTGAIGEAITDALLGAGALVVVPSRSADRLADLRVRLEDRLQDADHHLVPIVGDVGDPDGAREVRDATLGRTGRIDHVVASIGGWWSGPLVREVDPATVDEVLTAGLGAHLACAQALLPTLDGIDGATYTMLNGSGARSPVRGSGAVNVSAAAQLMLARVLAAEQPADGATVRSLVIGTPVITRSRPDGRPGWLRGEQVAEEVLRLIREPGDEVVVDLPRR